MRLRSRWRSPRFDGESASFRLIGSLVPVNVRQNAKTDVPLVHRRNVVGFRAACEERFGPTGYAATLALLPEDVREATAGLRPMDEWVPEAFIVAWATAVYRGPAQKDAAKMRAYVAATIAYGFGRVRRLFLGMMTAEGITERAGDLWRGEHTSGVFSAEALRPGTMRVRLDNHPYVESPLMRLSIAEALRYILSLTRSRNVTESHPAHGRPLVITFRWDVP